MFTCLQCGQKLAGEINFCSWCGGKINDGSRDFSVQQRLIEISRAMNSTLDLDSLLREISVRACELIHAETGSTMLYDPKGDELYFKVALGEKRDILHRLTVRDGVAWWAFKNSSPVIVNDTKSDTRFTGTIDKATNFDTKNILCVPIILTLNNSEGHNPLTETIGVIEVINKLSDPPRFTAEDQRILLILAYQAAIAVRNVKAANDRRNFFVNAIEIFITAIESTGFVPPGHCMRVARNSMGMAHKLGIEHDDLRDLYYASALHDIGVLDIKGRQFAVPNNGCPESHTIIGAEMVKPVNLLAKTEPIIRHHHEAWNGSGYPDGIKGDDIPLGARIVAVAEAYEDIDLKREFIVANAGKLFDSDVVDVFLEMEL